MTNLKFALLGFLCLTSVAPAAVAADLHIDIVHRSGPREPPPEPRVEHYAPRRGYVWVDGHYEWRHRHYVWRGGHYQRERRGYGWQGGQWEAHDGHYDWHRGGWQPHR